MVQWSEAKIWFIVIFISVANISADETGIERLLPGLFPTFREIPKTGFSCLGRQQWHYYADVETGCQVFHVCETQYSKLSFLCPIGSIFSQRHLVCVWWYNVDCQDVSGLYPENNSVEPEPIRFPEDFAASGGTADSSSAADDEKGTGKFSRRRS